MQIVARSQNRLALPDVVRAVVAVIRAKTGKPPPREMAKILAGQIGFETAWTPVCNNVGNLMAASFVNGVEVSHWDGAAWRPPWFEPGPLASSSIVRLNDEMLAGKEPSAFRAYLGPRGLEEGLGDWFGLLASHFPNLIRAAAMGDLEAFTASYKADRYCPACDPGRTAAAMRLRGDELENARAFDGIEFGPPVSGGNAGTGGEIILLAAAAAAGVMVWLAQRPVKR